MNRHLTSAQLDDLLFHREAAANHPHLLACETCSAELASLQATFGSLRSATTAAAARHQLLAARPQRSTLPMRLIGSFATAALALAVGLPIALHHGAPLKPNATAQTPQATPANASDLTATLTDDQLLTTVQGDLAASVPEPMQPLASTTSTQAR